MKVLSNSTKYSVFVAAIFAVLSTVSSQTLCSSTGIYFEEVAKSCVNYTRCIFGLRSEHFCDEGFQFDPTTSRCDLPSIVKCNKCPENIEFGNMLAYSDTANCSIGFVCFGETYPFQINCSESLHFDADTLMCILPEYSNCTQQVTTTEIPSTTTTSTTTTTRPTSTTTTTARPTLPPTTTQDDDVAPTEKSNQVTNEDDDFGINSIVNSPTGAIDLTRKTVDSYGPKTAMDNIDVTVSDDSDSDVGYTIFRKRTPSPRKQTNAEDLDALFYTSLLSQYEDDVGIETSQETLKDEQTENKGHNNIKHL